MPGIPLITSILFTFIQAQFVDPPTDLIEARGFANVSVRYKQVPAGICEQNPNVKSFAGYADVGQDQHIFWWFFEARQNPQDAPLTIWINGGPGSSSMMGIFQENGPCSITIDRTPENNPYSWTEATNMLYIDQPTLTGFSYSNPQPAYISLRRTQIPLSSNQCPLGARKCGTFSTPSKQITISSTPAAAPGMWKTIQGFMGVFPQYSQNDFIFATESYGGKYGPVFSEYFAKQNDANITGTTKIRLTALLIGNGWHDALLQYPAYYNYTVSPGNSYDVPVFPPEAATKMLSDLHGPNGCVPQLQQCYSNATDSVCATADASCAYNVQAPFDEYSKRDNYDIRQFDPSPFPPEWYQQYLNTEVVQKGIGAFVNYTDGSDAVGDAFTATGDDARPLSVRSDTKKLLDRGIQIIMYYGDADFICNWLGGEAVANDLQVPGFEKAGYVNVATTDGIVRGQARQAGNFAFVRVYDSGHMVPYFQPRFSLEMLRRVIRGVDIATGKVRVGDGFVTNGTVSSTYHEGNGTVVWNLRMRHAFSDVSEAGLEKWEKQRRRSLWKSFEQRDVGESS